MASGHGTRYPAWAVTHDARQRGSLTVETAAQLTGLSAERIVDIETGPVSSTADELFVIVLRVVSNCA